MQSINLYIHIPFCQRRCNYCGFYTRADQQGQIGDYFQALKMELLSYRDQLANYQIKTIYFGGGTPSLVDAKYIADFLEIIYQNFHLATQIEISIEANPESLNIDKLKIYKSAGINRLSIGLQALQDKNLKFLGRVHSQAKFLEVYHLAKSLGFKNINVDLIFGYPDHRFADWQESVEKVASLKPQHISCYSLELDKNSAFGILYKKGKLQPVDEELDRKMYHWTIEYLQKSGYQQYEISNFAKNGFECQHNLDFWHYKNYLGLGASAYSFWQNKRFANVFSIKKYIDDFSKKVDLLDNAGSFREAFTLQIRLNEGVDIKQFNKKLKINLRKELKDALDDLENRKLIKIVSQKIYLTSLGKDLENQVIEKIMEFDSL